MITQSGNNYNSHNKQCLSSKVTSLSFVLHLQLLCHWQLSLEKHVYPRAMQRTLFLLYVTDKAHSWFLYRSSLRSCCNLSAETHTTSRSHFGSERQISVRDFWPKWTIFFSFLFFFFFERNRYAEQSLIRNSSTSALQELGFYYNPRLYCWVLLHP